MDMTLQVRSVTLNFTLVRAAIGREFMMIEKNREDKKFCEYFRNHPQSLCLGVGDAFDF